MSLRYLTNGEAWYYFHDPAYHRDIKAQLKELDLPLRLPPPAESGSVTAYMSSRARAKGFPYARKKRYRRELQEA